MEAELDALFDLPLGEFTARRNELAARLKAEGRSEDAAAVRSLPKPSLAAWALNQVVRREPGALSILLESSDRLRSAQEEVMGGGNPETLRAATRERRAAVAALTERTAAVLRESGSSAAASQMDKVRAFLMAAPMDDSARALLEAGRLGPDLTAPEPDAAWGTAGAVQEGHAPVPAADRKKARREAERLARAAEQAEELAAELASEARDADVVATQARMAASEARRASLEARRLADEAARRL